MKQKNVIPIKDIVLNKENIKRLAECIACQENVRNKRFTIRFTNDLEIESDDVSIFENDKFKEYEIKFIYMYFVDQDFKKEINVYLFNYREDSYATISYENEEDLDWLAITENSIKEKLSFCEKHNKIRIYFRNDWLFILIFSIVNIFTSIFITNVITKFISSDMNLYSKIYSLSFAILEFFTFPCKKLYDKAFPSLEINIKENTNRSKKARNTLRVILTLFVLPIITDIFLKLFNP